MLGSTSKAIGVLLALCGNTLIACSLTLQKKAHNSLGGPGYSAAFSDEESGPRSGPTPAHNEHSFLSDPTWWMGTALMAFGEVGNFTAFAFAPSSVIAPLGAWSVVLAAILAHAFLGEPTTKRNVSGIVLCVSGAFLIGTAGPDLSEAEGNLDMDAVAKLLVRPPFMIFMVLTLCSTAALMAVGHFTNLGDEFVIVHIGVSSLLGAITVVAAKALATFLRLTVQGESQFGNWLPLFLLIVLAVAIVTQLRYLNLAMARFGNSQVVPVYYVLFTLCAMTSGALMYREWDHLRANNVPFFIGIAATMTGVFFCSRESDAKDGCLSGPSEGSDKRAAFEEFLSGEDDEGAGDGEREWTGAVEGHPVRK